MAGSTTASMVMWPTAETCDATLLSSPSRLWLTWCLETEAIFIFSNSKFLWGNMCNICQHWFKSECFAWDSWSFHKRSITIITNTNHKKVSLLWKKMKPVKSHGSKLSYMLVAESMPFLHTWYWPQEFQVWLYRDKKPFKEEGMQFKSQGKRGLRYCLSDMNAQFQTGRILKQQLHFNSQSEFLSSAARQTLHDKPFALSQRLYFRLSQPAMRSFPPHWSLLFKAMIGCKIIVNFI